MYWPVKASMTLRSLAGSICLRPTLRSWLVSLSTTLFCALFTTGILASSQPPEVTQSLDLDLTDEERAWIVAHPVVAVGVMQDTRPIEYIDHGDLHGLSIEFLTEISRRTGLKFSFKPAPDTQTRIAWLQDGTVDMLSMIPRNSELFTKTPGMLFTSPYQTGVTLVVTRAKERIIREWEHLAGKTVVMPKDGPFTQQVQQQVPTAKLIFRRSAQAALELVAQGKADAAVGSDVFILPYYQRRYEGMLRLSGSMPKMTVEIAMAVSDKRPVLHAILEKSLHSLHARQTAQMRRSWINSIDLGAPPVRVLIQHYGIQGALILATLLMLGYLVYTTRRDYLRALKSEREKAMFLSVMSHEIRSPMNAVLASLELLQDTPLDERQRHLVGLANSCGGALLRLLDNVLDLSKLEAGKFVLEPEPTDVPALAREVLALHELTAAEKGVDLMLKVPQTCTRLMLDATRINQILHNLISNALKFTDSGHVDIQVDFSRDGACANWGLLQISVIDTGVGITERAQQTLFQPYAQAAHGSRTPSTGTGLGLLICRELVSSMGGTINLRSAPGQGTAVTLELPVDIHTPALTSEPGRMVANPGNEVRLAVLLVEDIPANQYVLQSQLQRLGCDVVVAGDSEQALREFHLGRHDLVLMDCDLPGADGYQLARALRAYEAENGLPACPIIAISASTGSEHAQRCIDAGMDGVTSKPIRFAKLQDIVERWCGVKVTPRLANGPQD
ncbi:hypothetical protein PRtIB026_A45880 [Pseudomonas sp. RtIB026]|uniref:ATP-binding protein n=1 Tax=Pseudomonas sp. RtIB026 TaxID=2749999 RepID=UPI001942B3BA|nr:transporter substrate-binding domain-containing protein [Pseudomonas sp. RtIB026]BCJ05613.1 hypothetical protein PRtIB026_A45880 [Pseudomonas sp. RtIB026]